VGTPILLTRQVPSASRVNQRKISDLRLHQGNKKGPFLGGLGCLRQIQESCFFLGTGGMFVARFLHLTLITQGPIVMPFRTRALALARAKARKLAMAG
jgi:hypothetical protein